jgi:hypothetical protein
MMMNITFDTVFDLKRPVSCDGGGDDVPFVWDDYVSIMANFEGGGYLDEVLKLLRDPTFEFTEQNCDPAWLRADKRLALAVAIAVDAGYALDAPGFDENIEDWLEREAAKSHKQERVCLEAA